LNINERVPERSDLFPLRVAYSERGFLMIVGMGKYLKIMTVEKDYDMNMRITTLIRLPNPYIADLPELFSDTGHETVKILAEILPSKDPRSL